MLYYLLYNDTMLNTLAIGSYTHHCEWAWAGTKILVQFEYLKTIELFCRRMVVVLSPTMIIQFDSTQITLNEAGQALRS